MGDTIPAAEEIEPDELEYPCDGVDGAGGVGDEVYDEPKNFLVVENNRVGSRRFDEYCS